MLFILYISIKDNIHVYTYIFSPLHFVYIYHLAQTRRSFKCKAGISLTQNSVVVLDCN